MTSSSPTTTATSVWHVTWEFPPLVYGGLARHVEALTAAQAASGLAVTVVTSAEDVRSPAAPDLPGTAWVEVDGAGGAADGSARPPRTSIAVLRAAREDPRLPWTDLIGAARQLEDALVSTAMLAASDPGEPDLGEPDLVRPTLPSRPTPPSRPGSPGVGDPPGAGGPPCVGALPRECGESGDSRERDAGAAVGGVGGVVPGLPEVVHAHDWTAAGAATTLATGLGVPLVLTVHATEFGRRAGRVGPDDGGGVTPALVHSVELAAVKDADAVIVCSHAMREEVITALGADPARVHVVPNAVDAPVWAVPPEAIASARAHWIRTSGPTGPTGPPPTATSHATTTTPLSRRVVVAEPSQVFGRGALMEAGGRVVPAEGAEAFRRRYLGPLVVAAGRLEWEKGFSTLIRALPRVVDAFPEVRVVLAGRGTYEKVLRELVAEVGVEEHVAFPGWLDPPELAALYAAADAVVVPSRYEPSGLVAREAQAAGATVVASSVGGLTDVVRDRETGRLFAPGDVDGLAAVLADLLADPPEAARLAAAGTEAVRTRTWADAAADTAAVYAHARTPDRAPMC